MFSFFRRKDKFPPVPDWAKFLSPEEYQKFLVAVQAYFTQQGLPYSHNEGVVQTMWTAEGGVQQLGLLNVAQICRNQPTADYPELVGKHFDMLRKTQDFMAEFFDKADDFEFVKPFIGVRVYAEEHAETIGFAEVVRRDFAAGMVALAVFDLPQTISTIQPSHLNGWNKTVEEIFEIGLENARENYPVEIGTIQADFKLLAVINDHFFGPNILLELENHPELIGDYGTLIAVPHRHTVLFHPIDDFLFVQALQGLMPMSRGMFEEGPGSISPDVYWYRQGIFERLEVEADAQGQLSFKPSTDLINLMEYLATEI